MEEVDTNNMGYIVFVFVIMARLIKFIDANGIALGENDMKGLYDY